VTEHRRTAPRDENHGLISAEDPLRVLRHPSREIRMPRVPSGLATARLRRGEVDIDIERPEQSYRIRGGVGEKSVAQTGHEE